jgi:hypothetical protein
MKIVKTPYSFSQQECKYGQKCNDITPSHRKRFSHKCQYGETCERKNAIHKLTHHSPVVLNDQGIRIYTDDKAIKAELDYSNTLFREKGFSGWRTQNGNFDMRQLRVIYYNSLDAQDLAKIKQTFYFNLLAYIVCNLCDLVKEYEPGFLASLCMMFDEEAVTGIFRVNKDEELWTCIDRSYGLLEDDLGLLEDDLGLLKAKELNPEDVELYKREADRAPRFISNTHIKIALEDPQSRCI